MTSLSSHPSQSLVDLAFSATRIVVTFTILIGKQYSKDRFFIVQLPGKRRERPRQEKSLDTNAFSQEEIRALLFPQGYKKYSSSSLKTDDVSSVSSSDSEPSTTRQVFSLEVGSPGYVEFYLPLLNSTKNDVVVKKSKVKHLTALKNILRPWQCDFLQSVGLVRAEQFLVVNTEYDLAEELQKFCAKRGFPDVEKSSCEFALRIWARTCKEVVESFLKHHSQGKRLAEKPKILRRNISVESLATLATEALSTDDSDASASSSQTLAGEKTFGTF